MLGNATHLIRQNVELLEQGLRVAEDADLSVFRSCDGQSGIGAHLRHCMDCYRCFLDGLDVPGGRLEIDYDARSRDAEIEREPGKAAARLAELIAGLERLPLGPSATVSVRVDTPPDAVAEPAAGWQRSSVGRELQFLISHTIHHYAMIAMIARGHGLDLGDEFGVAPATLAHRRELAACAQ